MNEAEESESPRASAVVHFEEAAHLPFGLLSSNRDVRQVRLHVKLPFLVANRANVPSDASNDVCHKRACV